MKLTNIAYTNTANDRFNMFNDFIGMGLAHENKMALNPCQGGLFNRYHWLCRGRANKTNPRAPHPELSISKCTLLHYNNSWLMSLCPSKLIRLGYRYTKLNPTTGTRYKVSENLDNLPSKIQMSVYSKSVNEHKLQNPTRWFNYKRIMHRFSDWTLRLKPKKSPRLFPRRV